MQSLNAPPAAWRYVQCTGKLYGADGALVASGYSGACDGTVAGDHRNQVADESLEKIGPIPRGFYTIGPAFDDLHGKGPVVMRLAPDPGNQMFGRSGFMIHGDLAPPRAGQASEGCIILNRSAREAIAASPVRRLIVA